MNLIRCPQCHNQIASDAPVCPVCGCRPQKRRVTRAIKWTLILLCCGWAAEQLIAHRLAMRHSASHHSNSRQHV